MFNGANIKEILYSAQKNIKNKNNHNHYEYMINKKYPPFPQTKMSNKIKNKSLVNEINNIDLNLKNINLKFPLNNYNNTFHSKNKTNTKIKLINQDMNNNNNIHNKYFQMNINMKEKNKEEYNNKIYDSSGKQKNFERNLSEEQQIKKNRIFLNNQRNTLRKDSSYDNKILYNKNNNNFFNEMKAHFKHKIKYNVIINKQNINYQEILSKSSFSNSINNMGSNNNDYNYNYINSYQINKSTNNNNLNNNRIANLKSSKYQKSLKNIIPNKNKYIINNNMSNNQINVIKNYSDKNKIDKLVPKKSNINNNNNNNNDLNNNLINNDNILFKIKTASYTPINNNINSIFTNPNNENENNQNYMIRDSLIYENNNSNYQMPLNKTSKDKNLNDKSCPKFNVNKNVISNYAYNNYTNINNINNQNNYIVNINKYINIINKKNKIIRKNNSNTNSFHNYKTYKIINNSNNINKKNSKKKYIKRDSNLKNNNNYMSSPKSLYLNKYKNINRNNNLSSSKDNYIYKSNNYQNINNNNYRINTQANNNINNNEITEFKKLKILNNINKNYLKNDNLYENKNINNTMKNQKKRIESDLKNFVLDSYSFKLFNKSNINTSLLKAINNNGIHNKKNKYLNHNKPLYNDSLSSSTKNLNSQRNSHNNYNTNINNIDKNNKKGRNEKYNLDFFFKPQTIGQKMDLKKNKINSNRNPNVKINSKYSNTISIIDREKENLNNKIKNDEYMSNNTNIIKLMKTVQEYKNKNNKSRYENYHNINKNINNKKTSSNYISNYINSFNEDEKNILTKKKLKTTHNSGYNEMANLKDLNDNRILQNITQNTLTMYSIYIISHYFTDFQKIGLSRIILLNKYNKQIPVICSNNNCDQDTNKLFDISCNKNKEINKPFITEFKNNIYINFYINNIQSNNIRHIQIINYSDIKNKISPVGKIELYQEKKMIFKGILNSNKVSIISMQTEKEKNNNSINEIKDLNGINTHKYSKENYSPYSLSKFRSMEDEDNHNEQVDLMNNNEYEELDNYYTTRGALYKGFSNLIKDYKNKVNNIINKKAKNYNNKKSLKYNNYGDEELNVNMKSFKNNDFDIDSLLSQKLSLEFNDTNNNNTIKSNNIIHEKCEIYNNNSNNILTNSNSNNKISLNNTSLNNKTKDENKEFFNLLRKTYNKNEIEDFDQIYKSSICRKRDYSSFNLKNNFNIKNYSTKNKNNINSFFNNNNDMNSSNHEEETLENNFINNNKLDNFGNHHIYHNGIECLNYIEFNKIRFIISSNYGHHKYVGLTGIELFNVKGEPINIETALTIGALPKDLRTLYNDEKENRIFENVFNKINNTNDSDNMWVTKLKKNKPLPFIELYFKEKLRVSKIKIYNYNERDKLNIGAKTIELYLDDEYYNTIYLKQGTGEVAYDFIKIKKNKNNKRNQENNGMAFDLDDSDINNNEDFGQDITFPIQLDLTQNDLISMRNIFYNSLNTFNSSLSDNNNNNLNKNKIKFASFLYKQSYETPYLPCGYFIKFVLSSNYYKGIVQNDDNNLLKYKDIGFNKIEIYDEKGKNIVSNNNNSDDNENTINYKIISNCEILHNEDENENIENINDKIIINGQKENGNNCLFYIFSKPIRISYIKFYPLKDDNEYVLNSVKEIKIFSDCKIIFEGNLYLDKPTIVLFTCEKKILNNIDENYLTKEINERIYTEELNDNYISLVLN